MRTTALAALALGVLACSGEPLQPPEKPTPTATGSATGSAPVLTPPAFRLPGTVRPQKVAATLTVVPTEDTFSGSVDIDLTFAEPSRVLWLHATDVEVSEAHLEVAGAKHTARVVPGGKDFLGFVFEQEIPAGPARFSATYKGRVSPSDDRGVFREKEGADVYLYTQFENIEARRAIPCFDEPGVKIPWQITLRVKTSDTALSNTPVIDEKVGTDGFKTVRFAETKPLPSYLVAFAVGPFEMLDAGRAGKNKVPIRFAVPRGKGAEAAFALTAAPKILDMLEAEYGIPYPYEKLDYVIIPELASFGAMENAGMITTVANSVLEKPGDSTVHHRYLAVAFMAHEAAHQWFGDLVTPMWWNDIWLNEGFATWMETKLTDRFDPEFGAALAARARGSNVMGHDGLLSARKVRQEVLSNDDISASFDGITYQKGAAVITMFEAWLGAETFQKGVRHYLERFAWKNATSDDFLTALGEGAGKDVKAAFSTFLDQPGVPYVTTSLACDASGAKLTLTQERFLPIGSKGSASKETWQIPVCVRYGAGKNLGRTCTLFQDKKAELMLPQLPEQKSPCPDWLIPKDAGVGYYRAGYSPKDVAALLDKGKAPLTVPERLSVVQDLQALALNAKFPMGEALARTPDLLKDPSAFVQSASASMLRWLEDDFVEPELRPNAKRFVNKVVAPRVRELGWQNKPGDSAQVRGLRENLLDVLITIGDEPQLFAQADALALKWLDDPKAIERDSVEEVLHAAASRGDKKLFDRVVALARTETDRRRRAMLFTMLASFREPSLAKGALALYLDATLDPRATFPLFWAQRRENREVLWAFIKGSFDALIERTPTESRAYFIELAGTFCDEPHRADVEAFFKERVQKISGGATALSQALEAISLCIAKREGNKESLRAFLKKY